MAERYIPFPAFADWQGQASGMCAFDKVAAQFKELSARQREIFQGRATRSAAVDSNAIEGVFSSDRQFSYAVATMAPGWESRMEEKGAHARPAFDAAMEGYNMVLDIATATVPLTEFFIRTLHGVMLSSQDEFTVQTAAGFQKHRLAKGVYKTQPNFPSKPDGEIHYYASPEETPAEMHRLVSECSSEQFRNAHPVVQASYIHYGFVCVHPFSDGNGRVARALASAYLYRQPGIPLVVFNDQKTNYYDALESAAQGDFQPFIDVVENCAVETMREALS